MAGSSFRTRSRQFCLGAVAAIALLQTLLGLAGLTAAAFGVERPPLSATEIPDLFRLVAIASFGSLAAYLLLGARKDPRVPLLGTLFLVLGVFYASPAIESLALALPAGAAKGVRLLAAIRVDALTPALLWLFFRDFPRALEWPRTVRAVSWIIRICVLASIGLISINLAIAAGLDAPALAHFDRANPASQYWTVVFGLVLPVPAFIVWRLRHAPEDERRRVRLFSIGMAIGGVPPILLAILPAFSKSVEGWARQGQAGIRLAQALVLVSIIWVAANTTYAIAVQQVLQIGAILRKAAQYAVARGATGAITALPFLGMVAFLYRLRGEPISGLFDGIRPFLIFGLFASGFGLLRVRRAAMGVIDQVLFRESYDARRILSDVAERSRTIQSIDRLASSLTSEIDRALHLESVAILVEDPELDAFVPLSGPARALPRSSPLIRVLSESHGPLLVELDRRGSVLHTLPDADRQWLADAAVEVAVPLMGSAGSPIGLLTLGAKRSELPYSKEDLLLLSALGSAAGISLENRLLHASAGRRHGNVQQELAAAECSRCGWLGSAGEERCPECSAELARAHLPLAPFGKFRLERRLGAGAMGVVYRATDVTLGRSVALKTLPVTSPEDSVRLRREARAMAAITHPNLALIFGAETWQGTPVLVMEYLAGGTLAERLSEGPLTPSAALRLASTLASVLDRAHASGILHRDIKPSNIGFTDLQVPKLLDFGLVRIAGESAVAAGMRAAEQLEIGLSDSGLAGTPLYMSPEALIGAPVDPTFDLWSLSVVAFEAIAGFHPFERDTPARTLAAIREGCTVELSHQFPGSQGVVAELFATLLAPEQRHRPSTARKLEQLFEEAERTLSSSLTGASSEALHPGAPPH